jgi:hypothetical protein
MSAFGRITSALGRKADVNRDTCLRLLLTQPGHSNSFGWATTCLLQPAVYVAGGASLLTQAISSSEAARQFSKAHRSLRTCSVCKAL